MIISKIEDLDLKPGDIVTFEITPKLTFVERENMFHLFNKVYGYPGLVISSSNEENTTFLTIVLHLPKVVVQ